MANGRRCCSVRRGRGRPSRWRRSSKRCSVRRSSFLRIRRWPHRRRVNSRISSLTMRCTTSFPTMTTTSRSPMCRRRIPISRRIRHAMRRSTACATRRRWRFSSGGMSSSWHRCPVSTVWVIRRTTALWGSRSGRARRSSATRSWRSSSVCSICVMT